VEVEVEVPVEVEVIREVEVEVPVEVPVEVIKEVPVEVIVTETVEVEVPMPVENERFYKPGVYFNNSEMDTEGVYTYAVVVVDAYGQIAGVMFDQTVTESEFLTNGDDLYVFIEGNGVNVPDTYRYIAVDAAVYPTFSDAITADDLVVGIHAAAIAELEAIDAYETRMVRNDATWKANSERLAARIMNDQSTYGITTMSSGAEVTATNIDKLTFTNVDVLMGLVQDILDGDAKLMEDTVLADSAAPAMGLYTTGSTFAATSRLLGSTVTHYMSFVVVDEFGAIAGVYTDTTYAAGEGNGTKWILGEDYVLASGTTWMSQAQAFGEAVVLNQSVANWDLYETYKLVDGEKVSLDADAAESFADAVAYSGGKLNGGVHAYSDEIAGATVGVEGMLAATDKAIGSLSLSLTDGTYLVSGEVGKGGHAVMYVTIASNAVESVFLDTTRAEDAATVMRDGEYFELMVLTREWLSEADEEQSAKTLVYMDGEDYILVNDWVDASDDNEAYDAGDDLALTAEEIAALELVPGNYTKFILADQYIMGSGNAWYPQATAIASALAAGPYSVNFADADMFDITGVTIGHAEEYRQLLIDAILLAKADKPAPIVANVASGDTTAVMLPAGTYFTSLEADVAGTQYFAYGVVGASGVFETVVIDAAIAMDDYVTTAAAAGLDLDPETAKLYFDVEAAKFVEDFVAAEQSDIITAIEAGANFEMADKEFGTVNVASGVDVAITEDENKLINDEVFEMLVEGLVKEALKDKVATKAAEIFALMPKATATDFYSERADVAIAGLVPTALDINVAGDIEFDLDIESTDNGILDVDLDTGQYEFQVGEVEATTDITITMTLDFDDYIFTKDFTYTVQTVAAHALDNLNAQKFAGWTQTLGFAGAKATLPTFSPTHGSGLGWFEADIDYTVNPGSGITTTTALAVGTHTLTYAVEYDADKYITDTIDVVVVSVEDGVDAIAATIIPANILNNGEVTSEEAFQFVTGSNIYGVEVDWVAPTGNSDVIDWNAGSGILTLTRAYVTEKIEVSAVIGSGLAEAVTKDFEFRAVKATEAMVQDRLDDAVLSAGLGVMYFNTSGISVATDVVTGVEALFINLATFEAAADTFSWATMDADGNDTSGVLLIDGGGDLVVNTDIEGTYTIALTTTVEIATDVEVAVTEEYEIIFYKG
jgi:hypothetical protein